MVNEFSASASEIFAAAIQDYKRGLVIGSSTTFGKGTVQRNIDLERTSWVSNSTGSELGSIKLTLQKFYRITGASTQLKGVASDIVLPDQYEYLKLREKDDPYALPWDEIGSTQYKVWKNDFDFKQIIQRSKQRIDQSAAFQQIKEHTNWLEKNSDKVFSLKLDQFRKDKKDLSETIKSIDTLTKLKSPLKIENIAADMKKIEQDSVFKARNAVFLRIRKNDLHLGETVNVMSDMIQQFFIARSNQSERIPN
jgi:carboxyl-terminal processing protease